MSSSVQTNRYENMTERFGDLVEKMVNYQCHYQSAIREVQTKLEILDDEFQLKHKRNPIHHMQSRLKSMQSIVEKLKRRNLPLTFESLQQSLTDIAGIRVICSYIDDIYMIADLLLSHDDITLIKKQDYIKAPKANGYRSLHLIVNVPIYLSDGKVMVPVEIQIRTIAMDFWASLEHQLRYKEEAAIPREISDELLQSAESIAAIDIKMQSLYNAVNRLEEKETQA